MMTDNVVPDRCPQCGANLPATSTERVTCEYCGVSLIRTRRHAEEAASEEPVEPQEQEGWAVRLRRIACVDQQGTGLKAFQMLIPADWGFEGGVQWRMDNPGMPAVIAFRVSSPQGPEAFEAYPSLPFYWTNNPMVTSMFPIGSRYYGNEVRPPMPALQALEELVIPRYLGQRMGGLEIVERAPLPDLGEQMRAHSPVAPTVPTQSEGARVRIRYRLGQHTIEEDVFGVVEIARTTNPMMMGAMENVFWACDYLFSFRARGEHLEALSDVFHTMVGSFRLDPQWYGRVMQMSNYMVQNQIQHIHQIGQLSQMISQTSNQISDMMMDAYNQRQQTLDRLSDQFSQAIRGVDEYYDTAEGHGVELPSGYEHAWSNGIGEYILTNDHNFDPNLESTMNWEHLERN